MKRLLGLDYGERRVGVAVSDPLGCMALPLVTLTVESRAALLEEIQNLCTEYDAGTIVVGAPVNMDGSHGAMVTRVNSFCAELEKALNIAVHTWDERLSTALVERTLLEGDMSRGKRKKVRDKLAAQVILQGYMDARLDEDGDPWDHEPVQD